MPGENKGTEQHPGNTNQPVDYDVLMETDTRFSSWIEKHTKKAVESAVQEAGRKWRVMHDNSLSEAERLRNMTAEEQAEYYRKKFEDAEASQQRKENARKLEGETASLFSESGIPNEFLPLFNFETATAESVKSQIGILSKFEFYPKGTFEQKVQEALNQKLQQKPPETITTGTTDADLDAQMKKALENGDSRLYIQLANEKAKKQRNKE